MNKLLALLLFTLCTSAVAQTYPENGCMIRYQYDDSGNRIQRDWYCWGNEVKSLGTSTTDSAGVKRKGVLAETHMNVFPNPAIDRVTVTFTQTAPNGTLLVQDATGRTALSQAVRSSSTVLDLNGMQAGSYWLVFRSGDERIVSALVVGNSTNDH
jgi:hypothetical protein